MNASKPSEWRISSSLALLGGFMALLYAFYDMERFSFSLGAYYGAAGVIRIYNITPEQSLLPLLSQSSALALALHITYAMLPFALIISGIGLLWFFSKSYARFTSAALIFTAIAYLATTAILQSNFSFNGAAIWSLASYAGGALALIGGAYTYSNLNRKTAARKSVRPIAINPETPYTNMNLLSSRLMGRLSGEIKILDMHFDAKALDNLMRLINKDPKKYVRILVMTKPDRIGSEFNDFKKELENKGIGFELRIMNDGVAVDQHERIIMDDHLAFKIPPLNIINKKSEHIVGLSHREAKAKFDKLMFLSTKYENLQR